MLAGKIQILFQISAIEVFAIELQHLVALFDIGHRASGIGNPFISVKSVTESVAELPSSINLYRSPVAPVTIEL
jgi:hypothetical protein